MEFGKVTTHEIKITPTINKGFIVSVGCATLAFENQKTMIDALEDFLSNPEGMEKRYNEAGCQDAEVPSAQAECTPSPPLGAQLSRGGDGSAREPR